MLDWNLQSTWESQYTTNVLTSQGFITVPGYWRKIMFDEPSGGAERKAVGISNKFTQGPPNEALIVGGGFGYLAEKLAEIYPDNIIINTDVSTFIQGEKSNTEAAHLQSVISNLGYDYATGVGAEIYAFLYTGAMRATIDVYNEDMTTNQSRRNLRTAAGLSGGQKFDIAISDDVLPALSDADAIALDADMRSIATTVVHLVTVNMVDVSGDNNWKTIDEWRALVGPSRIVKATGIMEEAS